MITQLPVDNKLSSLLSYLVELDRGKVRLRRNERHKRRVWQVLLPIIPVDETAIKRQSTMVHLAEKLEITRRVSC
jgi:hypothetical protein